MSVDVAVVGSANIDLVVDVPRRPAAGETLLGGTLRRLPGGKGANQAAAAARCGARVEFTACVGRDSDGALLRSSLAAAGVGLSGVHDVELPTGTAIILLTPDGENSIVVASGANTALDIERANARSTAWISARTLVLNLEIPFATVTYVAHRAADAGVRVIVNAAPAAPLDAALLARCDPLIVNEHEARDVLGATASPGGESRGSESSEAGGDSDDEFAGVRAGVGRALAEGLLAAGAQSVVVTLGAAGAVVAEPRGVTVIDAYRVPVVDTTGAGDAFVGAAVCELAHGAGLVDAVRFATAAAALSVQRIGAQSSYADRAQIEAFIADAQGGRGA